MLRYFIYALSMLSSYSLYAFPCIATVAKDSCWLDYDVNVIVLDANTHQQLAAVHIPKGQTWERANFTCQPSQTLMYKATFSPVVWAGDENTVYEAMRFWTLPAAPRAKDIAWEIPICFSQEFAEVPAPPQAAGNCLCDFKDIPAIKQ